MPRVHITILNVLHYIVNELELEVYLNEEKHGLEQNEMKYLQMTETTTTEKR